MEFEIPEKEDIGEIAGGTIIIPNSEGEYPDDLFEMVVSRTDDRGGTTTYKRPLLESTNQHYTLDIEALAQLAWEHRQYSAAQEFSPREMDVLRTVQLLSRRNERILTKDVKNHLDYADSTISTALTNLTERGLLSKDAEGVYRYKGFDAWIPPEDS